jgi:hypothetical protein
VYRSVQPQGERVDLEPYEEEDRARYLLRGVHPRRQLTVPMKNGSLGVAKAAGWVVAAGAGAFLVVAFPVGAILARSGGHSAGTLVVIALAALTAAVTCGGAIVVVVSLLAHAATRSR